MKVLKFLFAALFVGMVTLSAALSGDVTSETWSTIELLGKVAHAGSECGTQDSEAFKKVKSGNLCYCDGQIVASQSCEGSGNGCSAITCDSN